MSEDANLKAIKRTIAEMEFALIPDYYNDSSLENIASLNKKIEWHAEAMARELAESEARAGRWKVFARALGELNADLLSGPIDGSEAQATFQRKREQVWAAESDLYQHGDLPDAAGEERA